MNLIRGHLKVKVTMDMILSMSAYITWVKKSQVNFSTIYKKKKYPEFLGNDSLKIGQHSKLSFVLWWFRKLTPFANKHRNFRRFLHLTLLCNWLDHFLYVFFGRVESYCSHHRDQLGFLNGATVVLVKELETFFTYCNKECWF